MRADASPYICKPDPTNIYPLSLHDALPISARRLPGSRDASPEPRVAPNADEPRPVDLERRHALQRAQVALHQDRKSTRLNSSHSQISYAVFCLKKKK